MRVAIIGSGPAGFYAAEALLKRSDGAMQVDLFDRLPTPYGLVRAGVAPDHQNIKAVSRVFDKTAARASFRFLGNVRLGRDLTVEDLRRHYHQIIYAVGNEADRRLGIPGEGIAGCTPATVFIGWYNGHPDYRQAQIDLSARRVAVVGNGNVAIDAARILLRTPAELEKTDIAAHALVALRGSQVREVFLLGRRGPAQAAFTPTELQELGEMEGADAVVDPRQLATCPLPDDQDNSSSAKNLRLLHAFAARGPGRQERKLHLRFLVSPTEILADAAGKVRALVLQRNLLETRADGSVMARGSGEHEELEVGLILPAIGFAAEPIVGVPFDERAKVVANRDGRVIDPLSGSIVANEYVVGWARSGPQGLIGTHKGASARVVELMAADADSLAGRELPDAQAIVTLLRDRGVRVVSFEDWKQLDAVETARGLRRGAPRDKVVALDAMLEVLAQR